MLYVVAAVFCLLGALCVISIVFSLPGGWIVLALACIIEFIDGLYLSAGREQTFGWWLLGGSLLLLVLGEVLEFAAGAAGTKAGGGSKRGMIGALIGGIAGALVFTFLVPIPFVGSLIGALLGTFAGAVVGEIGGLAPKTLRGSMRPALGATIGRVIGTTSKIGIAIAVWIGLSIAAFWP